MAGTVRLRASSEGEQRVTSKYNCSYRMSYVTQTVPGRDAGLKP